MQRRESFCNWRACFWSSAGRTLLTSSCLDSPNGTRVDRTNSSKMAARNGNQAKLVSSWATRPRGSDYFEAHLFNNPQNSCVNGLAEPLRPVCVWCHAAVEEVWRWYTTLTCYLFPACPSHVVTHCLGINSIPVNPVPVFFNLFLFFPPQQQRKAQVFKSLITCGALGREIIAYLWQQPPSLKWLEQQHV